MKDRAPKLSSIEVRLKDMDRMGIDIQAVSPAPQQTYYWTDPGEGQELARMVNDRLAEIVSKWPDRFVALGTVPLQDASSRGDRARACREEAGPARRGDQSERERHGPHRSPPSLEQFFAKAQELDSVIFMHPVGFTHGERLMNHYFNNVIGNPLETTVAASHLIFDGVMERYPKLKVVLPHAGRLSGALLGAHGPCLEGAARLPHRDQEEADELPGKVLFRHDYVRPHHAENLVARYGADHVVLGTDYPYDMGMEHPVDFIGGTAGISASDKGKIMGGNAARLLGISANRRNRR